jgi:hypothetical protein
MTHPAISSDGTLDLAKLWQPTAKNKIIRTSDARNRLRVGGTGSSKSSDAMMEGVQNYLLAFPGCFGLILRRTMDDLRKSNIPNFRDYVPAGIYKWNASDSIATFYNGSKLFFSHMTNFSWKDMESYQSSSFPFLFIDECGGFPVEVWMFLQARNRVNPECRPNAEGKYPIPCMLGATNPIGAHWGAYAAYFVEKKPPELPKGSRKDVHGRWWSPDSREASGWRLEYDPFEWDFVHSTVMDNPHMLAKDPGIVDRLNAIQPESLRLKMMDGRMDVGVGQYFDCFDRDFDTINLREDPDAIIWQYWQPRWLGWDWGRAHWNAVYWFTKALVRRGGGEYKLTNVCYREYVDRGLDYVEMADIVEKLTKLGLPGQTTERKGVDYRTAYFSHEKFSKVMEDSDQQSKLSKALMDRGLAGLTRGTTNRVGRATLTYTQFKRRELVVLDSCPEIIRAIPNLARDPDNTEDVEKIDGKADDCYDGFSLGLFGELGARPKQQEEIDKEKVEAAAKIGTQEEVLTRFRLTMERDKAIRQAEERRPDYWE